MKQKWIAGVLTSVLFLWLALVGACNLDFLLRGQRANCSLHFPVLLASLHRPHVLQLFFRLAGLGILVVVWMLFGSSSLNYKSGMSEVVPGLKIPKPEGQGQYGTAWWLRESSYDQTFAVAKLDKDAPVFHELIDANLQEREEIEGRLIIHDTKSK